jgi:amino acid adenylation domain-containing protein
MNDVRTLLIELRRVGVHLWVEGDQIRYRAPKGVLSADRLAELKSRKADVLPLLKTASIQQAETGHAPPPLVTMPRGRVVPLSFEQERLWLLEQIEGLGSAYNVAGIIRMTGCLDVAALEACFHELVRRHEALRTRFEAEAGIPHQVIDEPGGVSFNIVDHTQIADAAMREAETRRQLGVEASRLFDLKNGPLFRVKLVRLEPEAHVLMVVTHHIISDGWSIGILIREIEALYGAFVAGRASPLPALTVQCADYAIWQRSWLHGEALEKQLAYWKACLADAPTALELPTDYARPALPSYRGGSVNFRLSSDLTNGLKRLSLAAGATLFMVLLAGFQLLLKRYSGQEDIVVGSPTAGRTHRELEGLIGFFTNTLALRTDLSGNPTFRELVQRVKETSLEAYAHQGLPFEKLVEELRPVRDASRQPIFQFLFVLLNLPDQTFDLPNLRVSWISKEQTTSKLDLSLYLQECAGMLEGYFEYAADLFERPTIERLANHFCVLLEAIVSDPDARLNTLPLVTVAERNRLVEEWNQTVVDYRHYGHLHEQFSERAARTPDAVALIHESRELTYDELNRRVNRLACRLRRIGIGPETVVGLCLDRSFEMVTSMLAVMKAGGLYLPLEPSSPRERIDFMLDDANVQNLITCNTHRDAMGFGGTVVIVDDTDQVSCEEDCGVECSPLPVIHSDNAASIVYTSGSTGRPKGVIVTHRSLTNFLCWRQQTFALRPADKLLFKASYGSDFAIPELFWGLVTGASVVLASVEDCADAAVMIASIRRQGVTVVELAPSLLWTVLDEASFRDCSSVRTIISGGESLSASLAMRCADTSTAELVNVYGPCEATVEATYWRYDSGCDGISIGRPISNMRAHVLDDDLQPLPIGLVGELYLAGAGIARGYWQRPSLTAERFVPSPFETGERLYRTGDLVRRFKDGNLEFLGRRDRQLKVRGYRVELGEIEAALTEHSNVDRAVVVARQDEGGDIRLIGYVVANDGSSVLPTELRVHLQRSLPDYMVPSSFVLLDRIPITANGKIDLKALPTPTDNAVARGEYVAPRTPAEETLAKIWRDILKLGRVGVYDNFFELGGNSLLAMQLMARIRMTFRVEVPVRTLFDLPTLGELSLRLDSQQSVAADAARAAEEMVAAMSPDEVRAMLQRLKAGRLS